ncbi:MAG: hypothetical protein LBU47_02535 [Christensenellaceae bacterium]|jgi:hypothetical protein|nr:hypothetical protein [Christensenellaceae bacterium]
MDHFREEIVARKSGKGLILLFRIVTWFFIVTFALIAMLYLSQVMAMNFDLSTILPLLVFGGLTWFLYVYKDNLRTEYEYAFTNGEIDFAKVLGNKRRKALLALRLREVEAGGYVDSPNFDKYLQMAGVKRLDFYLNGKERLYYLYFTREGRRQLLVFEPSETLVKMMGEYSKAVETA